VAEAELARFAQAHNIPVVETVAGKTSLLDDDRHYVGPIGVTGCEAANNLAADADVVVAVGCRLQDFTTGSWTIFKNDDTVLIGVNTTRFDAIKHRSLPVVGDARDTLRELSGMLDDYRAPEEWMATADREKAGFAQYRDEIGLRSDDASVSADSPLTYAQVVRTITDLATPDDVCLAAAGGFPGEVNNGWVNRGVGTFDCEYGYSCMGYEISGGWGAAMAYGPGGGAHRGDGDVFVFVGDGSYLMMNSDLYSSVLGGHKMIVLVCDNGGFAVINRLQTGQGGKPFNNLLEDVRLGDGHGGEAVRVDFAAHARSMGCLANHVTTLDELRSAVDQARSADRTTVISMEVDAYSWTEGGSFWEVGVPEVSALPSVEAARAEIDKGKREQRIGW
jgi:3D-(3,5/4)-trihydroxycyclohexane-1,2-dione acylhydrolase (decyclizing)